MTEYTGSYLCGGIRFSFLGNPRFVKDCVCESCRTAHGASAVCWAGVKKSQFHMIEGEGLLSWYSSSAELERGFCKNCGTRLLFRSSRWPGEIHIALACVSTPHDLVSTDVSFKEELPEWTAISLR